MSPVEIARFGCPTRSNSNPMISNSAPDVSRKSSSPSAAPHEHRRVSHRDEIITSIGELSVTPRVIRHLSRFLRSPDEDMSDAIEALRAEPVLTAAILAACNAPMQYRGGKITDLPSAVHRIGYRETYRIALLVTFRQGLRLRHVHDSRPADFLWRRAAIAACAMERFSIDPHGAAAAYTVGILHLIGCFILARDQTRTEALETNDSRGLADAQQEWWGIAYPEAGAIALQQWGFPPSIWVPIGAQLQPAAAGEFAQAATQLGQAAEIALRIEACRPGSPIFDADTAAQEPDELLRGEARLVTTG
jgi:HD-like signal output (HDOD) protein